MKNNVRGFKLIFVLAVFAGLSSVQAQAQNRNPEQEEFADAIITLSVDQTLRLSVINPLPARDDGGRKFKVIYAPLILGADGRELARRSEVALDPGRFHSFDFSYAELLLASGQTAGSLQVRAQIRRRVFPGFAGSVTVASGDVEGTVELIDNFTGQTQASTMTRRIGLLHGGLTTTDFQVQPATLGLAAGQLLRVNVAHTGGERRGLSGFPHPPQTGLQEARLSRPLPSLSRRRPAPAGAGPGFGGSHRLGNGRDQ